MTWTFKEMIKSIFKKTRTDINNERRQRIEADSVLSEQVDSLNSIVSDKVDISSTYDTVTQTVVNTSDNNLRLVRTNSSTARTSKVALAESSAYMSQEQEAVGSVALPTIHKVEANQGYAALICNIDSNNINTVGATPSGAYMQNSEGTANHVEVDSTKTEVANDSKVLIKAGDNVLQVDATNGLQMSTDGGSTWGDVGGNNHLYAHKNLFA